MALPLPKLAKIFSPPSFFLCRSWPKCNLHEWLYTWTCGFDMIFSSFYLEYKAQFGHGQESLSAARCGLPTGSTLGYLIIESVSRGSRPTLAFSLLRPPDLDPQRKASQAASKILNGECQTVNVLVISVAVKIMINHRPLWIDCKFAWNLREFRFFASQFGVVEYIYIL